MINISIPETTVAEWKEFCDEVKEYMKECGINRTHMVIFGNRNCLIIRQAQHRQDADKEKYEKNEVMLLLKYKGECNNTTLYDGVTV